MAPTKPGIVAISVSGDMELGDYGAEPLVFFKAGQSSDQCHLRFQFSNYKVA
jgi:hypothetical protein